MRLVSIASCRPRGGCPPSSEGGFGRTEPLRPFGAPPLSGRLLVRGSIRLDMSLFLDKISMQVTHLLLTPVLSDKAFRRLYTVRRRNAMEWNRRRPRLCPPGKAPIRAMAGGIHGVRGPALAAWKFWLAPGRLCLLCRVQSRSSVRRRTKCSLETDSSTGVCRLDWVCG